MPINLGSISNHRMIGCWLIGLLLVGGAAAPADAPPRARPRVDADGENLPPKAVARLGSLRYRMISVAGCAISPDGKLAAAGTCDGIHLFEIDTGKTVRRLAGKWVGAVQFSPDGKTLAAAERGFIRLWDVRTGRLLGQLPLDRATVSSESTLIFSPDSQSLAAGTPFESSNGFVLWNLSTHQPRWRYAGHFDPLGFTPDGQTLVASDSQAEFRFLDTATSRERRRLTLPDAYPYQAVSPDFQTLAVGPTRDEGIILWDLKTGKERCRITGRPGFFQPRVFSRDGKILLVIGPNRTIGLLDAATGKELRRFQAPVAEALWVYPFGEKGGIVPFRLFVEPVLRFWDIERNREHHPPIGHRSSVESIVFAGNDRILVSGSPDHTIRTWHPDTGRQLSQYDAHDEGVGKLAITADGRTLASSSGREPIIRLWDAATRRELCRIDGRGHGPTGLAFAPDGRTLAASYMDDADDSPGYGIQFWDVASGREVRRLPIYSYDGLAYSPDGRRLATLSKGAAIVWNVTTGEKYCRLPGGFGYALAFSPNGRILAVATSSPVEAPDQQEERGQVTLWEVSSGKPRRALCSAPQGILSLAFSPNGRQLAVGERNGIVRLWDVNSGAALATYEGHREGVTSLAFSRDGRKLASGSFDTTILVWDVTE